MKFNVESVKEYLDAMKYAINETLKTGEDYWHLIWGYEGSGKSVTTLALAIWLDRDFNPITNFTFTQDEYLLFNDYVMAGDIKTKIVCVDDAHWTFGKKHRTLETQMTEAIAHFIREVKIVHLINTQSVTDLVDYIVFKRVMTSSYAFKPKIVKKNEVHYYLRGALWGEKKWDALKRRFNLFYRPRRWNIILKAVPPDLVFNTEELFEKKWFMEKWRQYKILKMFYLRFYNTLSMFGVRKGWHINFIKNLLRLREENDGKLPIWVTAHNYASLELIKDLAMRGIIVIRKHRGFEYPKTDDGDIDMFEKPTVHEIYEIYFSEPLERFYKFYIQSKEQFKELKERMKWYFSTRYLTKYDILPEPKDDKIELKNSVISFRKLDPYLPKDILKWVYKILKVDTTYKEDILRYLKDLYTEIKYKVPEYHELTLELVAKTIKSVVKNSNMIDKDRLKSEVKQILESKVRAFDYMRFEELFEKALRKLLQEGEIYELAPHIYKVV